MEMKRISWTPSVNRGRQETAEICRRRRGCVRARAVAFSADVARIYCAALVEQRDKRAVMRENSGPCEEFVDERPCVGADFPRRNTQAADRR